MDVPWYNHFQMYKAEKITHIRKHHLEHATIYRNVMDLWFIRCWMCNNCSQINHLLKFAKGNVSHLILMCFGGTDLEPWVDSTWHSFPKVGEENRFCDTVDGQNPAPVDMVNIPLFTGFYTSQVVQGSRPSTVALFMLDGLDGFSPAFRMLDIETPFTRFSPKHKRSIRFGMCVRGYPWYFFNQRQGPFEHH